MMRTGEPRIVHCPGCQVLLVEPSDPIYQCGQCSMKLYAKHAIQSNLQMKDIDDSGRPSSSQYKKEPPKTVRTHQDPFGRGSADANGKPLDTPRIQTRNRSLSRDKPPLGLQDRSPEILMQDMRKLARDAFPSASQKRASLESSSLNGTNEMKLETRSEFPTQGEWQNQRQSSSNGNGNSRVAQQKMPEPENLGDAVGPYPLQVRSSKTSSTGEQYDGESSQADLESNVMQGSAPHWKDIGMVDKQDDFPSSRHKKSVVGMQVAEGITSSSQTEFSFHDSKHSTEEYPDMYEGPGEYEPSDYLSTCDDFDERSEDFGRANDPSYNATVKSKMAQNFDFWDPDVKLYRTDQAYPSDVRESRSSSIRTGDEFDTKNRKPSQVYHSSNLERNQLHQQKKPHDFDEIQHRNVQTPKLQGGYRTPPMENGVVDIPGTRHYHHSIGKESGASIVNALLRSEPSSFRVEQQQALVPVTQQPSPAARKTYPRLESPYVVCQHCNKLLQVPRDLPPCKKATQKLRCGSCQKISRFSVDRDQSDASSSSSKILVDHGNGSSSSSVKSREYGSKSDNVVGVQLRERPLPRFSGNIEFAVSSTSSSPVSRDDVLTPYFKVEAGGKTPTHGSRPSFETKQHIALNTSPEVSVRRSFSSFGDSPIRGSAPASFHHAGHPSNVFAGKGYDSAPEFHSKASDENLPSSSHARTDSGSSNGRGFPTAPCLHELFGYESPSQFLEQQHQKTGRSTGKGIKGFLMKSIQDISKIHQNSFQSMNRVMINGKAIPDELVRKAEGQAGPVHPGSYWYDVRAGFWGVMGGPCLGIIPPYIEEFNHPMPVNCAGGKTGIIVNGRELHQKDLERLVQRGLPATPNMSYTVDIDGRVLDLATESERKGLGKLAPSIQKRGVGHGMFPLSHG